MKKTAVTYCFTAVYDFFCDPGGTRTPNRQNRNLLFYPIELRDPVEVRSQKYERKCEVRSIKLLETAFVLRFRNVVAKIRQIFDFSCRFFIIRSRIKYIILLTSGFNVPPVSPLKHHSLSSAEPNRFRW